jgi:two-component system osmolarity sensor histidine kinase EnvZ
MTAQPLERPQGGILAWFDRRLGRREEESRSALLRRKLRKLQPKTLLARVVIIVIAPVVLAQLIITAVFYEIHWNNVAGRLARALVNDVNFIIAWRSDFPGEDNFRWIQQRAKDDLRLTVTFEPNAVLQREADTDPFSMVEPTIQKALQRYNTRPFFFEVVDAEDEVLIHIQLADGVLQVISPLSRLYTNTSYTFILAMVGTTLILLGIALLFMHRTIEPIRRLAVIADSLGKGREVPDFQPEGVLETRQAAQAFLTMRERLRRQVQQRTEMLAGVSHDLRTPLTRMRLGLAMMGDSPDTAALKGDIADMERMIEGYLAFARGDGDEEPAAMDIGRLIDEVAGDARRAGGTISTRLEGNMKAIARPLAMKRCLANLVANAQRYGKTIAISAARRKRWIEIIVDDDGPGIPPEQREDVFRPFVRLEQSRNPLTGGVGLGLTIARDIVRGHGGDLVLLQSPMRGLRARLRLPV